jgi:hypothetical protein
MRLFRVILPVGLWSVIGLGQNVATIPFAPVPADPLEMATAGIVVPATPDQRLAAQQIIVKARDQYKLHAGSPFDLKLTFNATGQSAYEGPGALEELWLGMNGSRWTAQIGNYTQTRVTGTMGLIYDDKPTAQIPMRLQQLREAVFSPIYANPQTAFIRTTTATWSNENLTCVLMTRGSMESPTLQQRRWSETEWCVNTQSGLLRIASEAPGVFTVYDYTDSIRYHDLTLPRNITVTENGNKVLDIRIDSVTEPASLDRNQLATTPSMKAGGPVLREPLHHRPTIVRPVVVHAVFGADGKAVETEIADSSDPTLNGEALSFVKGYKYSIPTPPGAVPEQSQVYLTVRFFQAR